MAFRAAETFAELLEKGNQGANLLLDQNSLYYKNNVDSIAIIVHDTLKYGEYIRIYDLSISTYASKQVIVSGFMENRSFYGWKKYYIDIYLSKDGNAWLISTWNTKKT